MVHMVSMLWVLIVVIGLSSCVRSEDEEHIANWTARFADLVAYRLCFDDKWSPPNECRSENATTWDAERAGDEVAQCWAKAAIDLAESAELRISDVLVGPEDYWVDFELISEPEFGTRILDCSGGALQKHGFL